MEIKVVPLTEKDIPEAIEVIQQAFADDLYFKWVFDPTKFNKQRNFGSLEARCRWGINNAIYQVAKEVAPSTGKSDDDDGADTSSSRILGVSCWLAPHPASEPESWYSWTQGWLLSFRQFVNNARHMGRGGLNTRRYWIWKDRQREAQGQIWDDPRGYYFCNIVAVSPEAQGKGIGKMLFQAITDRADEEGVKCYLESSKDVPNVEIYRRMGFEMAKEMECRDGGDVCMLYCMVRNPRPKC